MGYCMTQRNSRFTIRKENFDKVIDAIKGLGSEKEMMSGGSWQGAQELSRHFSWVNMSFVEAEDIMDIFSCWRWNVCFGPGGHIDEIWFSGEKYGDDPVLFNAIAPYVEDGSYIEMQGEEGELWRWVFKNGQFKEVSSKIVWEE